MLESSSKPAAKRALSRICKLIILASSLSLVLKLERFLTSGCRGLICSLAGGSPPIIPPSCCMAFIILRICAVIILSPLTIMAGLLTRRSLAVTSLTWSPNFSLMNVHKESLAALSSAASLSVSVSGAMASKSISSLSAETKLFSSKLRAWFMTNSSTGSNMNKTSMLRPLKASKYGPLSIAARLVPER